MMTPKERWLAALRMKPVDRLLFWPKLDRAYERAHARPEGLADLAALHAYIGSDRWTGIPSCLQVRRTRTSSEAVTEGAVTRHIFRTPYGELARTDRFDEASQARHPMDFPVKRREDLAVMAAWYEDQRIEVSPEQLARARAEYQRIGDGAIVVTGGGTTPLMEFVQHVAGVENAHWLLNDFPDEVEALFTVMARATLRRTELESASSPADGIMLTENTSTTLISPQQFLRYCFPVLRACAQSAQAAGKPLALHMCGHLKALLPDLARVSATGFEAFTTPPVGNTTLLDGRTTCPDVCLIGGTNAASWTLTAADVIREVERDLAALPHHRGLVITSAGVMPQRARPDTIKAVCEWVKAYPARM